MRQQLVLIGGQAEEVALLLHPFDRGALRADADAVLLHHRLRFGVVGLVAHRVPAGVAVLVDVAVLLHAPPDLLRRAMVARLGGADEIVVGAAEGGDHLLEQRRIAVGQLARLQPFALGRLLHLDAVLVGAGQEIDVVAVEPLEAGDRIGRQRLIGMADMRGAVGIGDGRRDVELWRLHRRLALLFARENRKCRRHRKGLRTVLKRHIRVARARLIRIVRTVRLRSRLYSSVSAAEVRRFSHTSAHLSSGAAAAAGLSGMPVSGSFSPRTRRFSQAARRSRKPSQPSSLPRPVTLSA